MTFRPMNRAVFNPAPGILMLGVVAVVLSGPIGLAHATSAHPGGCSAFDTHQCDLCSKILSNVALESPVPDVQVHLVSDPAVFEFRPDAQSRKAVPPCDRSPPLD